MLHRNGRKRKRSRPQEKDGRRQRLNAAEERRRQERERREIQNFWSYTGDAQAPIQEDEL